MSMLNLSKEEQLILYILKEVIVHDASRISWGQDLAVSVNWEKFKRMAGQQELLSFVFPVFKKTGITLQKDVLDDFYHKYISFLIWALRLEREYIRIAALFSKANVDIVPIKGIAFLEDIYVSYPSRQMCDIDVLIKEEDFQKAENILQAAGYLKDLEGLKEEYWRKHQCHIVFKNPVDTKKQIRLEVHWALDFKRGEKMILPELWQRVRSISSGQGLIKVLSPEDNLFSLALHLRRMGNILRLKNVLDAALILKHYTLDWEYILKESTRGKMRASVFFLFFQAHHFLGPYIPSFVWEGLGIPLPQRKQISSFITKETFMFEGEKKITQVYKKGHFLFYDSFWEPIFYILNIPLEQFAKFYNLKQYNWRTRILYYNRIWYMFYREVADRRIKRNRNCFTR